MTEFTKGKAIKENGQWYKLHEWGLDAQVGLFRAYRNYSSMNHWETVATWDVVDAPSYEEIVRIMRKDDVKALNPNGH